MFTSCVTELMQCPIKHRSPPAGPWRSSWPRPRRYAVSPHLFPLRSVSHRSPTNPHLLDLFFLQQSINDFFTRDDALSRLDQLHCRTLKAVEKVLQAPRPLEFTHNVLDLAVQKVAEKLAWKLLTEARATPTSVGVPVLLDLCIAGVTKKLLVNSTPYKVLEDLMEGQTISACEKIWELLESRKDKLTTVCALAVLLSVSLSFIAAYDCGR